MLNIRKKQFEAFSSDASNSFADDLTEMLIQQNHDEISDLNKEIIQAKVLKLIALGNEFGLTDRQALSQFITLGVILGEEIYAAPEVVDFLRSEEPDQNTKMDSLVDAIEHSYEN